MQLRLSALTPFLLAALVRGQIERDGAAGDASTGPLTAKDLAALPKPDAAPLPVVPCEGALLEDYELYLKDYPEKKYGTEEYAERCSHFYYSNAYVTAKEAEEGASFEVALNQFADFSPKELANLGGALPPVTNPKPAPTASTMTTLGANDAAATTTTTTTTTTGPIPTENAQLEADPANAVGGGDASATGADATPEGRKRQARKERRMERRRAARRRDLAEGAEEAGEAAAATGGATTTAAVAEEGDGEAAVAGPVVTATEAATEAATEVAATAVDAGKEALWDLSAFVGDAAEALAAEAPAVGIQALRAAPEPEPAPSVAEGGEFETMGLRNQPAAAAPAVDRHGVNGPGTIAAVTRLAAPLPETLDYSTGDNPYMVEAVGEVKDTGKCGASWALAAAGLAESRLALDSGVASDDLSVKELVDCVDPAYGCGGGRIERALTYASNNGLGYEADNPWESGAAEAAGVCKIDPEGEREYLGVISQVSPCNQRDLMRALAHLGPVAAHVKSSCRSFLFYSGGILDDEDCFAMPGARPAACAAAVDHNVLIVGYDSDGETDYWIVKGNFGEDWGEAGYAKIKMSTRGLCGTGCLAAFPLTVVPRSFGIDAQGQPAYDGSAPSFLPVYTAEAEAAAAAEGADGVAPVDPNTILPGPLPHQRTSSGAGSGTTTTIKPPASGAGTDAVAAPEGAKADASAAEAEEAARRQRRSRIVGGAVGGAFAGVFALVAAFVGVKTLQRRREEMMPEHNPHLDVL